MIKFLDTKYKRNLRRFLIITILSDFPRPMTIEELDAYYYVIVKALNWEWIHPKW